MTQRSDYERTAHRRALLLTGDPAGAQFVLRALHSRYDDILRVGESMLARTVVQDARAWRNKQAGVASATAWQPPQGPARQLWSALASLPGQQREAFAFCTIEQFGDVDAARALDCSRNALREVHLAGAENVLRPLLGTAYESGVAELRTALAHADAQPAFEAIRADLRAITRRKRLIRLAAFIAFLICCGLLWFVMEDLHRANEREIRLRHLYEDEQQKFSVPMTEEEKAR